LSGKLTKFAKADATRRPLLFLAKLDILNLLLDLKHMTIIGITGTIGAGKGTIVEYLKTRRFNHYSARAFLEEEVIKRGLSGTRDNIFLVANDLRKTHFPGYIISELLKTAEEKGGNSIIESIRALGEIDILRKTPHFCLLGVTADPKLRYERIRKRNSSTDNISFEKFIEDEHKELESSEPWSQNLKMCMLQADFIFENNGSVEELNQKVEEVLKKLKLD
jgi:dephospho-CoA kinase